MRVPARVLRYIALVLIEIGAVGCFQSISLDDFEDLPASQPIHRYAIAHRGSLHDGLPDNSLPAIKESISKGVRFLEVDVRKSRDGDLFLFHDGSLKKSNFASPLNLEGRKVQELTIAERNVVRLDANGLIGIPTLREALEEVKKSSSVTLQIDLKGESDELLESVVHLLKQENSLSRAIVQLKDPGRIQRIRSQEPLSRILARVKNMEQLNQAIAAHVECVELERWITAEAIQRAHAANIVVVFNVAAPPYDTEETWGFFRSKGVDSIMTDHADRAE